MQQALDVSDRRRRFHLHGFHTYMKTWTSTLMSRQSTADVVWSHTEPQSTLSKIQSCCLVLASRTFTWRKHHFQKENSPVIIHRKLQTWIICYILSSSFLVGADCGTPGVKGWLPVLTPNWDSNASFESHLKSLCWSTAGRTQSRTHLDLLPSTTIRQWIFTDFEAMNIHSKLSWTFVVPLTSKKLLRLMLLDGLLCRGGKDQAP